MTVRSVWVVRAGRGAAHAAHFLESGVVAVDFDVAESIEGLTADELVARLRKMSPDESPVALGLAARSLLRLARELHLGDVVITPEPGGTYLVGEVVGPYRFDDDPVAGAFRHARPVRWFGRLEKSTLPEGIRNSLGSIMTLFAPSFQEELLGIVEPLAASTVPPEPLGVPAGVAASKPSGLPVAIPLDPVQPSAPSGSQFETDKRDLLYLLEQIENRDLALPDFQRSFVWDPAATRELIVSIIRAFPAGNLLFLRGGSEAFLPRAVEEAPALDEYQPHTLILDGQQRLSSLYQAFKGLGSHRFYVDLPVLMAGDDIDAAVKAFSQTKAKPWRPSARRRRSRGRRSRGRPGT